MRRAVVLLAVALAGCGSEAPAPVTTDSRTAPRAPERARKIVRVAAVGDSITAGYPQWDPSPEFRRQLPEKPDPRSQYAYWARRHLGNRFRFTNCGVSGARTDEISQQLDGCAGRADVLIVQGGINDLFDGTSVAGIARNLRELVRRGKSRGMRVLIAELLPVAGDETAFRGSIVAVNQAIHAIAREERAEVLRWYRVLEDPKLHGALDPRYTTDGLHPTVRGYRRLGEAVNLDGA